MRNSFDSWLRQKVERLESEIRTHPVFESADTPTPEQMMELRRLAAIHRFLTQQLEKLSNHPRVTRPRNRRRREKLDIRQFVNA
jgi:hypothetical protein